MGIDLSSLTFMVAKKTVVTDTYWYFGFAMPASATDAIAWAIMLVIYDVNDDLKSRQWASGHTGFLHKWTLRETYTYS